MNELVFIFCDCSSVVDSVDMQFRTSLDIYNLFQDVRNQYLSIKVILVKITRHSGICANDMAGRQAEEVANRIAKGGISALN